MRALAIAACFLAITVGAPALVLASPFVTNANYAGGFHIYGHQPVPQTNGFDYYFTPVYLDSALAGKTIRVTDVEVSVTGQNNGSVVNWDLETFIGPETFGLPEGQFIQTLVDPVDGYPRQAPIWKRSTVQEYTFTLHYFFPNGSVPDLTLSDGLRAQLFFWTADNRNCNISFSSGTVTISGDVVPDPASGSGLFLLLSIPLLRNRHRR